MSSPGSVEERFWSRVWRCQHRHPCKRCCWPWIQPYGIYHLGDLPGSFTDDRLGRPTMQSARVAYLLFTGTFAFSSRSFHLCHQCDYAACCNAVHVRMGSASDNARDNGQRPFRNRRITLPDGQVLTRHAAWGIGPALPPRHAQWGYPPWATARYDGMRLMANDYENGPLPLWSRYRMSMIQYEEHCMSLGLSSVEIRPDAHHMESGT